jgi:hypothetical protein
VSHERNTAEERYESVQALFGDDGPVVRQPYGVAYSGKHTGALTIQKGGLRSIDPGQVVIVNKHNTTFTVQPDGSVMKENEYVGDFEYAFRLGEDENE